MNKKYFLILLLIATPNFSKNFFDDPCAWMFNNPFKTGFLVILGYWSYQQSYARFIRWQEDALREEFIQISNDPLVQWFDDNKSITTGFKFDLDDKKITTDILQQVDPLKTRLTLGRLTQFELDCTYWLEKIPSNYREMLDKARKYMLNFQRLKNSSTHVAEVINFLKSNIVSNPTYSSQLEWFPTSYGHGYYTGKTNGQDTEELLLSNEHRQKISNWELDMRTSSYPAIADIRQQLGALYNAHKKQPNIYPILYNNNL